MFRTYRCAFVAMLAVLCLGLRAEAGNVWDGGGVGDANWTTDANWNLDDAPDFDGSEDITLNTINAAGTSVLLNGDKNINSLTTTPSLDYSINNNTLTLQSGNITGSSTGRSVTINSNVTIGANANFNIGGGGSGEMTIAGIIGDGGSGYSVTKSGARALTLSGVNTYSGATIHNGGLLYVNGNVASNVAGPLGQATSAVLLADSSLTATLVLPNVGQTFARDIEVSATGTGAAQIHSYAGGNVSTISGNIAMNRNLTIYGNHANDDYLNITGVISGAGNLTLQRNVRLSTANTYTGTTTIGDGTAFYTFLGADAPHGLPGAFGNATSDVVIAASGLFVDGPYTVGRNLSITGSVHLIQSAAGAGTFDGNIHMPNATTTTLSILNASGSQVFNGVISGQGGLLRNGGQGFPTYINNGNNSYTGTTEIRIGDIYVGADAPSGGNGALGNSTTPVLFQQAVTSHTSSLLINGAFDIGRDVNIANTVANSVTILGGVTADPSVFSGNIAVNSNSTARLTAAAGGSVLFSGEISGNGKLNKAGSGNVVLGHAGGNTYLGETTITSGALIVAAPSALGTIGNNTTVSSGATLGFQGNVNYTSAEPVNVLGVGVSSLGAVRNFSGENSFNGLITMTGHTTFGADAGQLTLANLITDGAGTFNFNKVGAGTVVLANAVGNSYNGATTIGNGTLLANNTSGSATGSGPVFISGGATLGGNGFIGGNVTAMTSASLAPGNTPGTLTINGNVGFTDSTSQFVVELSDAAQDQLAVNGTVTLNNATLSASVVGEILEQSKLYIVVNDGADAIVGTFDGLADGDLVDLGLVLGQPATAQISYFGDFATNSLTGGNDIVLYNFTGTEIPEPATNAILVLGLVCLFGKLRRGISRN